MHPLKTPTAENAANGVFTFCGVEYHTDDCNKKSYRNVGERFLSCNNCEWFIPFDKLPKHGNILIAPKFCPWCYVDTEISKLSSSKKTYIDWEPLGIYD